MSATTGSMVARVDSVLADLEMNGQPLIAAHVSAARSQLNEPLRVAVAGRVKAGKSTLINALAEQAIAATDATECTSIVTWYRYGTTARAAAVMTNGDRLPLDYRPGQQSTKIDLSGFDTSQVNRLEVELPIDVLNQITIIDTPGTASISEHISARAMDYLIDGAPVDAPDVVIYLMRHAHEQDLQFLEAYGETLPSEADPLRALGVLSRADEIGNGRADSMLIAGQLATRVETDLASMVTSVLPVAGLLAFAAATVDEKDYRALTALAALEPANLDILLRSAKCFVRPWDLIPVSAQNRSTLAARLGMFGLRNILNSMAADQVSDLGQLQDRLKTLSGIAPIRSTVIGQFAGRADVLRAARAVGVIEKLTESIDDKRLRTRVLTDLDAIRNNSYELDELTHLRALSLAANPKISDEDRDVVVHSLGGYGAASHLRLGEDSDATTSTLRQGARRRLVQLESIRTARGEARHAVRAAEASMRHLIDALDGQLG